MLGLTVDTDRHISMSTHIDNKDTVFCIFTTLDCKMSWCWGWNDLNGAGWTGVIVIDWLSDMYALMIEAISMAQHAEEQHPLKRHAFKQFQWCNMHRSNTHWKGMCRSNFNTQNQWWIFTYSFINLLLFIHFLKPSDMKWLTCGAYWCWYLGRVALKMFQQFPTASLYMTQTPRQWAM